MKSKFRCLICGFIHIGNDAPVTCPICGASAAEFELFEDKDMRGEPNTQQHLPKSITGKAKFVILGGGIAGLSAAEELRKNSDEAEITIISNEHLLPYYRLNLTRYLAGDINRAALEIYPQGWYEKNRIKILCGKEVVSIDCKNQEVVLDDKSVVNYDKLIVALGAHPFVPPIPGTDSDNVVTVRTTEDADFILDKLSKIDSCICVGGGILGLETAGAIAKNGIKVLLLEGAPWLMPRQLNKEASEILKGYLQKLGIEIIDNARTKAFVGETECDGLELETGEFLPAKLVMITAGVRPNTHLLRKAGLEVNQGVVVDNHLRTSDKNIYAAGDVCEHYGVLYGLWNAAQYQGRVAALNALGLEVQFGGMPRSNILKVLDLDLFSIGEISPVDGSYHQCEKLDGQRYYVFVIRDRKIAGSIVLGDKEISLKVKQAVESGIQFPQDLLTSADGIISKLMQQK